MSNRLSWRALAALGLAALLATATASAQKDKFEPHVGQAGKDVIWVPSPDDVVERMLTMAQVTPSDYVIDLGSGDGKIAIMAGRKFGARALGIEYNPDMVKLSQRNAQAAGVAGKVTFRQADLFATDFSQATVITMYLLPALNLKLRPQVLAMRPGTRVVSHSFSMEDWEADEISTVDGKQVYYWTVPAQTAGTWTMELNAAGKTERHELTLEQRYQVLNGSVTFGSIIAGLRNTSLRGAQVDFAYIDRGGVRWDFTGRVSGARMEGTCRSGNGSECRWTAVKR